MAEESVLGQQLLAGPNRVHGETDRQGRGPRGRADGRLDAAHDRRDSASTPGGYDRQYEADPVQGRRKRKLARSELLNDHAADENHIQHTSYARTRREARSGRGSQFGGAGSPSDANDRLAMFNDAPATATLASTSSQVTASGFHHSDRNLLSTHVYCRRLAAGPGGFLAHSALTFARATVRGN